MTTCMNPNENGLFYAHVEPSPVIAAEIAHFKKLKGLVDGEYVGVHLRYLEGKCPGRAKMFYMPAVEKQIAAMCHNVYSHTAKVVAGAGLSMAGRQLYLASDRQRPMADKTFEQQGSISYDRGNKKDKYFGDGTHFVTGHLGGKVRCLGVSFSVCQSANRIDEWHYKGRRLTRDAAAAARASTKRGADSRGTSAEETDTSLTRVI